MEDNAPKSEMPKYQSHKQVWALKIKEIVFDSDLAKEDGNRETDGSATITPEDEGYGKFKVDAEYCHKHKPQVGGYYVVYKGDYKSWSPAVDFEDGNTKVSDLPTSPGEFEMLHLGLGTFGQATQAAKEGKKVSRTGWNGSGMFAYIVPANSWPAASKVAKEYFGENALVPYRSYWALKTAQEDVATWTPSGSDTLAEDWCIVD